MFQFYKDFSYILYILYILYTSQCVRSSSSLSLHPSLSISYLFIRLSLPPVTLSVFVPFVVCQSFHSITGFHYHIFSVSICLLLSVCLSNFVIASFSLFVVLSFFLSVLTLSLPLVLSFSLSLSAWLSVSLAFTLYLVACRVFDGFLHCALLSDS